MNSRISPLLYTSTLVISLCFLLHLSPASSLRQLQPSSFPDQALSFKEIARLGSTPPSCRNKCNGFNPCIVVQVPTKTSDDRFQPGLRKAITNSRQFYDPSSNQHSNYKPIGWKCFYDGHFYNP